MANSIPASGGTLPDPNKLATGQAVKSLEVGRIPSMLNYSLNFARCQPFVSQTWADGICRYENVGGTYTDVATWRVPLLTNVHTRLVIVIRAGAGGGTGTGNVRFTSAGSGATYIFTVGATGFYFTPFPTGLTTAAIAATDYDEITMSFAASTGNEIIVDTVSIAPDILAAATLPAALIDGAEPFGIGTCFDPDYPLPASMGKRMITALEALKQRPRMLFCWSGLSAAVVTYTSGEASETMGGYPHWLTSVVNPGDRNKDLTVWVKTRADVSNDTVAKVSQWVINVPFGTGDVWRQPTPDQITQLEKSAFPFGGEFFMPQSTWKSLVMGGETAFTGFTSGAFSSAGILAVSVWGS